MATRMTTNTWPAATFSHASNPGLGGRRLTLDKVAQVFQFDGQVDVIDHH